MEEIIKLQLESLKDQRESIIKELYRMDFNNMNSTTELIEKKNIVNDIDFRIDRLLDRLETHTTPIKLTTKSK